MLALIVKEIIHETPDTRTYVVEDLSGKPIVYRAGQFLTLTINRNGREVRRSYSFSSTPGVDDKVFFTVKEVVNGEISRYLSRSIVVGSTLIAQEASGRFLYEVNSTPRDVFLIAAGSGVTPVFSLLKQVVKQHTGQEDLKLILQNRSETSAIFYEQFHAICRENSGWLKFFDFVSVPALSHSVTDGHFQNRPGTIPGRINNEILEDLIGMELRHARADAMFYICGPLSFMRMAEFTIRQMGFGAGQVKKEIFDVPAIQAVPFAVDSAVRNIVFELREAISRVVVQFPQTILDAALANHIAIPYSCKAGICGSCVVRCKSGKAVMKNNDVLTEEEVKDGLVLSCVGYAESDLVVEGI